MKDEKLCLGDKLILITFGISLIFMFIGVMCMYTEYEKIFIGSGLISIAISNALLIIRKWVYND